MHIEDYVRIGQQAADDLLSARFSLLAERLGYAKCLAVPTPMLSKKIMNWPQVKLAATVKMALKQ